MKKSFIVVFIVLIVGFLLFTNNVKAAVYEMDDAVFDGMAYEDFELNLSKLDSYDINNVDNSNIQTVSYPDQQILTFTINNNNKNAIVYEANANDEKPYLLKLMYKNVSKIGLRYIDVNVYVTKVALSDFWENGNYYTEGKTGFVNISAEGIWIGSYMEGTSNRYSADEEVLVTVEILWADDHTVVDLPFLNIQSDIDINYNTATNKTLEKWKAVSGYLGDYYIFSSSWLEQDANGAWYNTGARTYENDSYIKTGVYAPTVNGKFTSNFYEGVCASKLAVSMQTFTSPSKASSIISTDNNTKNSVNALDDKISYTITQKFGNLYVSTFTPYRSFVIMDTLDSNLNYESAQVILTDGNTNTDITNNSEYGVLSYNTNTRKVEYTLNSTWLSNNNNYKGQTITLTINTSLNTIDRNFTNTAFTALDGISFDSNEVEDTFVKQTATYKYISGTSGKELPEEISTATGLYKINDTNQYFVGETASRVNDVEVGTTYEVYENGEKVGTWTLKKWDSDSKVMTNDGVEFIGTWEYEPVEIKTPTPENETTNTPEKELPEEVNTVESENPITFDNIMKYICLFIVAILGATFTIILINKSKKD